MLRNKKEKKEKNTTLRELSVMIVLCGEGKVAVGIANSSVGNEGVVF